MQTARCDKMETRSWLAALIFSVAVVFSSVFCGSSEAAGLLIADGGMGGVLEIEQHDVHVTINNGVAVTCVTQVFHNTEKRQVEALYTFPIPKGASVANFSMWINGKEMVGEVLEKKRARRIYNSYKRKRRDPGLLEQKDYKTFEMRIFPINAGAHQKVQITYYQELGVDNDQATYVYPLATVTRRDINARTTGKFAISVDIRSAIPVTAIESPSHGNAFVVARHSDTYAQASLETTGGSLSSDVVIHYSLARAQSGLDVIASRTPGQDGYFLLTLTAGKELARRETGMDYVFLLDISGSMANDSKLLVSKNSVGAFIEELGEADRFEVMTFNVAPGTLFGQLQAATPEMKAKARAFMHSQRARGGTVLSPAMTTAYKYNDPDRTLNVVVLSDGMTEQKERRTLLQLIASRPRNARVFCIGVGNAVNRPLLEQLAEDSGGLAAFISRGDNFERQAKAFRRKLMRPAATDVQVRFEGVRVYDVVPKILPNLYHGSPIRIYGRYSGSGKARVSLDANIEGVAMHRSVFLLFPGTDSGNPEIERMWALKRVDQLLKTADRNGSRQQVVDEIVQLGEGYSIVTEYTSFLVLENDAAYKRWKIQRRNSTRIARDRSVRAERQKQLAAIRNRAAANIGPRLATQKAQPAQAALPAHPVSTPVPRQRVVAQPHPNPQSPNVNFHVGSGPVGPLFVGFALWMKRRKRKK